MIISTVDVTSVGYFPPTRPFVFLDWVQLIADTFKLAYIVIQHTRDTQM